MNATDKKPQRVQRKRTKGWKMPPNTVYVGRPSIWAISVEGIEMRYVAERVDVTPARIHKHTHQL